LNRCREENSTVDKLEQQKQSICEIGRRLYAKGFAAANEGNLSIRVSDDRILCTPTLCCKGFMELADICTVDMTGKQIAGERKRTSEVLLHIEVYKRRPDVNSVVHCHPPHATAFAVAGEPIPTCILPEPDIFLGEVPIAPYATPGNQHFAETILPFVESTNTIVLSNHGTVSYESDIERAYWLTEILDAYCRILILAKQLGGVRFLSSRQGQELLKLRTEWGFPDPRAADPDAGQGGHGLFGQTWAASGISQQAFPPHPSQTSKQPPRQPGPDLEFLIQQITDRIVRELRNNTP
jgi:L-fuculose-phosphate aldolase